MVSRWPARWTPDGTRTIGVLTKVDLMRVLVAFCRAADDADTKDFRDAGIDVVYILAGRVIPLRLGHVPVVNRGQRDIDTSKPIQ